MKERTKLLLSLAVFAACWFLPTGSDRFWSAIHESLALVKWYAREHVLLCLVPAFFIAGAISVFVSQGAVMKYLGPQARKVIAYPVAAVSGSTAFSLAGSNGLTACEDVASIPGFGGQGAFSLT